MNITKPILKSGAFLGICLLAVSSAVRAQSVIDVKVGTTTNNGGTNGVYQESGQAVLGTSTDYWNEFPYVSTTPYDVALVDNSDASTGVQVTINHSAGIGAKTTTSGINPYFLFNQEPYMNAGGVFTITLSDLIPNDAYIFVGYASRTSSSAGATWAVTDGTLISGTTSNGSSMDITAGNGSAYSEFQVRADGSGSLTITDTGSPTNGITVLSGFQIEQAVPEPATYALFGLGALALGIVYRRRAS